MLFGWLYCPRFKKWNAFSSAQTFIEKVFMPGLLLQLFTREDALPVERLSGVRVVVTIIGIILVGVLITPSAGWVA